MNWHTLCVHWLFKSITIQTIVMSYHNKPSFLCPADIRLKGLLELAKKWLLPYRCHKVNLLYMRWWANNMGNCMHIFHRCTIHWNRIHLYSLNCSKWMLGVCVCVNMQQIHDLWATPTTMGTISYQLENLKMISTLRGLMVVT